MANSFHLADLYEAGLASSTGTFVLRLTVWTLKGILAYSPWWTSFNASPIAILDESSPLKP